MSRDTVESVRVDEVELTYRVVGDGSELVVLLHGWPQTRACWRKVAGPLSRNRTVVAPDLRGYGESGLARSGYGKRATAGDLSGLIRHLGHESAIVIGHDRGARVAHRWELDRPAEVEALVLLDILPTRVVMDSFDRESASAMFHWFLHRHADLAETLIAGNVEAYIRHFLGPVLESGAVDSETFGHYVAAFSERSHLRASLEDYRAGFTTDLELDEADHARGLRVQAPLLALWGSEGGLAGQDVVGVWQEHHADPDAVSGHALPCGHYLPEEVPGGVVEAVESFLARVRPPAEPSS